jgi:hypothetical protein
MYIKATSQKDARYWFYENHDDKVITKITRGGFSHIDEYDGKKVYNYKIEWKKRKKGTNIGMLRY